MVGVISLASPSTEIAARQELCRFRFGAIPEQGSVANVFRLHIDTIDGPGQDEVWHTSGNVVCDSVDGISLAASEEHLMAHLELPFDPGVDFRALTLAAYRRLLGTVRDSGFSHLARTWNYFPGINAGGGDGERYKLFVKGRAVAFDEFGYTRKLLPAATAIGTGVGTPFTVSVLATRDACTMIDNPRQISPCDYPAQYGSTSPTFSRAVMLCGASGNRVLISGTASIVGHESRHLDDPVAQLQETLSNLEELVRHAARTTGGDAAEGPAKNACWRAYLGPAALDHGLDQVLRQRFASDSKLFMLRGDVCRRELQVEIEAACEL